MQPEVFAAYIAIAVTVIANVVTIAVTNGKTLARVEGGEKDVRDLKADVHALAEAVTRLSVDNASLKADNASIKAQLTEVLLVLGQLRDQSNFMRGKMGNGGQAPSGQ